MYGSGSIREKARVLYYVSGRCGNIGTEASTGCLSDRSPKFYLFCTLDPGLCTFITAVN